MERCGTHSCANIVKNAAAEKAHAVHEEKPFLCKEAQLVYLDKDFRTKDFNLKLKNYRKHKKSLVFEANHRLTFFIPTLMRHFGPENCKIIFLARNPIPTLISRISTWAHYKDYLHMYPSFFFENLKEEPEKKPFNEYRISPKKSEYIESLADLYLWEWLETYKVARQGLSVIPAHTRKIMFCEDLTSQFDHLLGFIGMHHFNITGEVVGWARTKSDSIYKQTKDQETDVFITQNRDPHKDKIILFARNEINKNKGSIMSKIKTELIKLPLLDDDIVQMDKRIIKFFEIL